MVTESVSTSVDDVGGSNVRGFVVGGVLIALLGLLALLAPFLTGIALSVLLGGALVVGALVHLAAAFSAGSATGVIWQVILGVVYGVAGVSLLTNPIFGLATLTLLVIGFLVAEGVVQLVWAVAGSAGSRLGVGLSGIVSLLLAGLLWSGFPSTALWAIGVLFGVDLLVTGGAMVVHGRSQRAVAVVETPAEAGS